MKKFVSLLLLVVLTFMVTGCSSVDPKIETATCTLNGVNNMDQEFVYSATNDQVDKIKLTMTYDNSMFGVETLDTLTDDEKEKIKTNMLEALELDKTSYEGLEITIDIQDRMTVILDADLNKADPEILKKVSLDFEGADMSFDRMLKDMKEAGATCNK